MDFSPSAHGMMVGDGSWSMDLPEEFLALGWEKLELGWIIPV